MRRDPRVARPIGHEVIPGEKPVAVAAQDFGLGDDVIQLVDGDAGVESLGRVGNVEVPMPLTPKAESSVQLE